MPPQAIAAAVVTALELTGTAAAIATVVIEVAVTVGLSYAANSLLSPDSAHGANQSQPLSLRFGHDSQEQRIWGYGICAAGGTGKYWTTTGTDNKFLWFVNCYHDTEIDGVESFYVSNSDGIVEISFTGNDATTAPYSGFMSRYDKPGTASQTTETNLGAAQPSEWTSNHRLRGIAYYVWKLTYDRTIFPNGFPEPIIKFRARKVWDPRLDPNFGGTGTHDLADEATWEWSQNAALCALDYVKGIKLNGVFIGGLKMPIAGIDIDSWVAAANICDEDVDLKVGGTEKRYTVNGMVGALEDKQTVFTALLQSMAAFPVTRNGKLGIVAAAAATHTTTLTDHHLAGDLRVSPSRSIQEKHNTVTGVYFDPLAKNGLADLAPYTDPDFLDADGGVTLSREIRHRFVNSAATAQRLNKIMLANEREQLSIEAMWKPVVAQIPSGGTFLWTSEAAGYTAQKMRVMGRKRQPDGSFALVCRQETDAKYDWAESTEEVDPPSFATHSTFDPSVVTAPGGGDIHVSATTIAGDAGSLIPTYILTADAVPSPFIIDVLTRYKLHTDTDWQAGPTIKASTAAAVKTYIHGLAPAVDYDFGFAYRTAFATSSYTAVASVTATDWNIIGDMVGDTEINTNHVVDNAITENVGATGAGPTAAAGSAAWTLLASYTITATGKPILLLISSHITTNDPNHLYGFSLTFDSTNPNTGTPPYKSGASPVFDISSSGSQRVFVWPVQDTPASGSHVYRLYGHGDAVNISFFNYSIRLLETKK